MYTCTGLPGSTLMAKAYHVSSKVKGNITFIGHDKEWFTKNYFVLEKKPAYWHNALTRI